MSEQRYRFMVKAATLMTVCWIAWSLYDLGWSSKTPEQQMLSAGSRYLEDRQYHEALESFDQVLVIQPDHRGARMGKAQTQMELGLHAEQYQQSDHYRDALSNLDHAIELATQESTPEVKRFNAVAHANRGILKDRMGRYEDALKDYQQALELDPEVGDGPGFLTRFLRNQAEKPPSITDRIEYLRQQLSLPTSEQVLSRPEVDAKQRAYTL
ncbi:MAG: tetratricopeptide repeat protein [Candidatus Sedimenticola sp. PURPLELP]